MPFSFSDPMVLFVIAVALFIVTHIVLRWALPVAFIVVSVVIAALGGFIFTSSSDLSPGWQESPFRHLVEGSFGFINLAIALFAGTFFGQMVRASGAADAAADGALRLANGRVLPVLVLAAVPIFAVGMFVGLAGVAVLSAGVFAVPALRRLGYSDATIAAFIAVLATAGMIAPPVNVPAMHLADGVNMPWTNVARSLLALSVPFALLALAWFRWGQRRNAEVAAAARSTVDWGRAMAGIAPFAVMMLIWIAVRIFPFELVDPSSPAVLIIGGLAALPMMKPGDFKKVIDSTFTGTPLILAAVLVTVGVLIQVMTLTGVRGEIVIRVMSIDPPWIYLGLIVGMPLLGGALTSMSVADVMGVPAAFSFFKLGLSANFIISVAALSSIAALAEFIPPTSVAAALACYVVGGGTTVGQVFRRAWPAMIPLVAIAVLMLVFANDLAGWLS
ncbi:MAG: TRAP transporter large permease subunit [Bauldia sp.]